MQSPHPYRCDYRSLVARHERMTSASVSKVTQNGSDVIVQIFRRGHKGYQIMGSTVRINGLKAVVQKAYDSFGKLVHYHPK